MANIYFKCIHCQKSLAVDQAGAGRSVKCTDCGKPITIPHPEIEWDCPHCSDKMLAPTLMSGIKVQCIMCSKNSGVPHIEESVPSEAKTPPAEPSVPSPSVPDKTDSEPEPKATETTAFNCPSCGKPVQAGFSVCIHCGLNFKTGEKVSAAGGISIPSLRSNAKTITRKIMAFLQDVTILLLGFIEEHTGNAKLYLERKRGVVPDNAAMAGDVIGGQPEKLPTVSPSITKHDGLGIAQRQRFAKRTDAIETKQQNISLGINAQCPFCGEIILSTAVKCKHCGEFVKHEKSASASSPSITSSGAMWSLIFGCVGIIIPIIFSIPAIIIGHLSRRKITPGVFQQQGNPNMVAQSTKCPSCGYALPDDAVFCVNCGLDFRTGKKVKTTTNGPNDNIVAPESTVKQKKKCPFCSEEIQVVAIKCKHCGEFLDGRRKGDSSTGVAMGIPALWNPVAVGNWSLLFSPVFGGILLHFNWKSLGNETKASKALIWVYVGLGLLAVSLFFNLAFLGLIFLIVWYLTECRPQQVLIKSNPKYIRKPWGQPVGIAVASFVVYVLVAVGMNSILSNEATSQTSSVGENESYSVSHEQNDKSDSYLAGQNCAIQSKNATYPVAYDTALNVSRRIAENNGLNISEFEKGFRAGWYGN